ncbi:RNA polymerase sigma factor CarQ [Rubripirellula tenax]|uniref:RNA polymerase sigma factor CarQ n=1 Tax=Rubripirellula tenax TaxID=2528015 RepID=A0A5C6EF94_9BACT|nr:sigma-70 family RNA polymerase sigma factor [Rubripirellula tenax]TWU47250.1 RNA polymerase sigma factor CarQ [Rubripirellula tenax]
MTTSGDKDSIRLAHSDRSLVRLVRDGDERAASELYDRYARRVFGLIDVKMGAKLRNNTMTEDIVQSVFKSIFRGVQAGDYDAPPGKTLWNLLAVIAASKLADKGNHHSAGRRDINRTVRLVDHSEELETDERSINLLSMTLQETLEKLSPINREILKLRIEGHSVSEISATTGRSHRTVERMLQKSRIQLANILLSED